MYHFSLPARGCYLTLFFLNFLLETSCAFSSRGRILMYFEEMKQRWRLLGAKKTEQQKKVSQPALKDERQASCHRCRIGDCSGSGLVLVSTSEIGLISWGVWICCFTETDKLMLWWGWWKLIHHQITFWNLIICDLSVLFITFCKNLYLSKL